MNLDEKLSILADAAKYDASCASSGSRGRRAGPGGIGSTDGMGICHSYTPDGRCVSLLKLLLTNFCIYDCAYCINRRSSGCGFSKFCRSFSLKSGTLGAVTQTSRGGRWSPPR